MPFQIIRDDITRVRADAIVNTANPMPGIGGGTDFAIHQAAGPGLLEARKKIGVLQPGQSAATPAYGLSAKYVLHTVSPAWIDGSHNEEALLRRAYDAALNLADSLGCRSAAFPLMAAGTYGFPHELALATAVRAFTDFLLDHEMQIELVLFNARAFGLAGSLFDDLKSYVDDHYVSARIEEEYRIDQTPRAVCPDAARRPAAYSEGMSSPSQKRRPSPPQAPAPCQSSAPKEKYRLKIGLARKQSAADELTCYSAADSLEELLRTSECGFSEYLLDLLRERDGRDSEVYKRAEVSKQLFSRILNTRDYQPTKSTAIQLAIGLQLDLPQTQKLLEKAGYALTRSSKADLVVQYYIERRIYSVSFINEALYDCGLPLLKTGLKA